MDKAPVAVVVLTYNEEPNIRFCLESVKDLTDEIFIVDSYSTDRTVDIAREYTEKIYQNTWIHFAHQRNWALDNLPIFHDWVLFLDADERLTIDLSDEIASTTYNSKYNGYYIKRNFYFLGKWIKHGGNQNDYILRLIRKGYAYVTKEGAWEYFNVRGKLEYLKNPIIHEDKKDISFWIKKHNKYSSIESIELCNITNNKLTKRPQSVNHSGEKTHVERKIKIWLREKLWIRLPILIRPFFYFMYSYFVKLGFLDGKEGFIYCFLHGLWYPFLVDVKYLELKKGLKSNEKV